MAIYLPHSRALILHVPRCAGHFVMFALEQLSIPFHFLTNATGSKHGLRQHFAVNADLCACFIRHPVSWWVSWWRYCRGRAWSHHPDYLWHPCRPLVQCRALTFPDFLRKGFRLVPGFVSAMFAQYATAADYVGTVENIAADLGGLLQRLGYDAPRRVLASLPPIHASRPRGTRWRRGQRRKLMRLERAGIDLWNESRRGQVATRHQ